LDWQPLVADSSTSTTEASSTEAVADRGAGGHPARVHVPASSLAVFWSTAIDASSQVQHKKYNPASLDVFHRSPRVQYPHNSGTAQSTLHGRPPT